MLATLILLLLAPGSGAERPLVLHVDTVETLDGETLEGATIIIEDGAITKIGRSLILPKFAEVRDLRGSGSTAMPPFVLSHSKQLQNDRRKTGRNSRYRAADSVYLTDKEALDDLLELGILVVGVDPPGLGLPGRTSVLLTTGEPPRPEFLVEDLVLWMSIDASTRAKSLLRDALKSAEDAIEKEEKAHAEWEEALAKQKAEEKKAADEAKKKEAKKESGGKAANDGGDKKETEAEKVPETFTPPNIPEDTEPVVEWVRKQRPAHVRIDSAAEWLHWLDVLGERELPYEVMLHHSRTNNLNRAVEGIAEAGVRVHLPALISFLPYTRTRCNLPAELAAADVEFALLPPSDSMRGIETWRVGLSELVRNGLDREVALRAVTSVPAASLGQEDAYGTLAAERPANLIVVAGDPLDPVAEVQLVIADGEVVYDREEEK